MTAAVQPHKAHFVEGFEKEQQLWQEPTEDASAKLCWVLHYHWSQIAPSLDMHPLKKPGILKKDKDTCFFKEPFCDRKSLNPVKSWTLSCIISNTRDSVSLGFQKTMTHSGVFLMKFEVFEWPMKQCFECLIYIFWKQQLTSKIIQS